MGVEVLLVEVHQAEELLQEEGLLQGEEHHQGEDHHLEEEKNFYLVECSLLLWKNKMECWFQKVIDIQKHIFIIHTYCHMHRVKWWMQWFFSQIVVKNFIKISLIIKEFPEDILIKLAIVLKISKSSWNTRIWRIFVQRAMIISFKTRLLFTNTETTSQPFVRLSIGMIFR